MGIKQVKPPRDEMFACVARATQVQATNDGFPDSGLPGCDRWICNYLGSEPEANTPAGQTAIPVVKHLKPGFGVSFIKASPGNGVPAHVHDTNETFMVLEGKWRIEWEGDRGIDSVELIKHDLISIPPGVSRRFENLETEPGAELGTMLGIIAGDKPEAEFSREAVEFLVNHGRLPAEQLEKFEQS